MSTSQRRVVENNARRGEIRVDNVAVTYQSGKQRNSALESTSVDIQPGEFVCILGPSGCGKSTLLNAIAGFVQPTQGDIFLDDQAIRQPGPDRSMVFQQHSLLPWKTVVENIAMGPRLIGDLEAARTVDYFLDMVGLSRFRDHYPDQLSGGMQQRVGIARALATYPKVLLMDEPFAALDYQTRLIMQENLLNLWDEFRSTVVFVTHDVDEAIFLSDRLLVMSAAPGRIVLDIRNPLPRPREQSVYTEPAFIDLKRQCMAIIRQESLRTF